MRLLTPAILLIAALALAACNNPRGGGEDADAWGGDDAIGSTALGDPNDPDSIAHFNEMIGDRVFFTVDQTDLSDEARETLRDQASWLNRNPQFAILVEGHADERGTREYNVALGARRANSVQEYLVEQGVEDSRIRTVSYGKERPVEACAEQRCWDLNRRAVTVVSR
ncbi:MAG: peptidoglycan-associated lipoprotein [Rhodobacteraceae bacterium HLUCCA12]|nr:MAG: peptidoglycan-associated lipoprotein [Rhodobacteraceae bacterium HLUCCA12]